MKQKVRKFPLWIEGLFLSLKMKLQNVTDALVWTLYQFLF
jgi:hypothetical protein